MILWALCVLRPCFRFHFTATVKHPVRRSLLGLVRLSTSRNITSNCVPSAIVAAVIAGVLFAIGINRLDARNLTPHETIRQLEKDKDTVKGMVR